MDVFKNPEIANRIRSFISIRNEAINKDHLCMLPGCYELAINSHIIQRSQFLEPIANKNGKLLSLETKETYPGKLPRFRRTPIRSILTFKGFCSYHDQLIFSEIEKHPFDLTNRKHLALFSYRGICHELNKKQITLRWMESVSKDHVNFPDLPNEHLNHNLDLQRLGIKDISFYKDLMEQEIIRGDSYYSFQIHKLPYREVITSVCFNIEDLISEDPLKIHDDDWRNTPLKYITMTILPKDDELILIIGYLGKHTEEVAEFVENLGGVSLNFVNKILLEWVETWACSESFYSTKVEHQLKAIQEVSTSINIDVPTGSMELPNMMD